MKQNNRTSSFVSSRQNLWPRACLFCDLPEKFSVFLPGERGWLAAGLTAVAESMLLPSLPLTKSCCRNSLPLTPLQPEALHTVDTMAGALQVAGDPDMLYLEMPRQAFPAEGR